MWRVGRLTVAGRAHLDAGSRLSTEASEGKRPKEKVPKGRERNEPEISLGGLLSSKNSPEKIFPGAKRWSMELLVPVMGTRGLPIIAVTPLTASLIVLNTAATVD